MGSETKRRSAEILTSLGIEQRVSGCAIGSKWLETRGKSVDARSPIDGKTLATVTWASADDVQRAIQAAADAFKNWRNVPAPKRGEFVRRIGVKLRERKADLAHLVSLEAGKIMQESLSSLTPRLRELLGQLGTALKAAEPAVYNEAIANEELIARNPEWAAVRDAAMRFVEAYDAAERPAG
jgi:acyl-CoA reductase-like NAD-dependent aldehyde dehydrogenase